MRKLVTIRTIDKILPIKDADFIELVIIGGWQCIAKKGEFQVKDKCIYFEIDSFLPADDTRFAFLGTPKSHQGKLGHRIRTMQMRKQLSQGLALPLNLFPELHSFVEEDIDLSEHISVIKYDNAINMDGTISTNTQAASVFPSFLRKTDQERIQNLKDYFEVYKDEEFEETLKLDGSSMTVYKTPIKLSLWKTLLNKVFSVFDTEKFGVCSRNIDLKEVKGNAFWDITNICNLKNKLPINYALQGELIGPKIQNNHEKVLHNAFYIFAVFNIKEQRYLSPPERISFCSTYGLTNHIPVVNTSIRIFQECPTFESLLHRVEGASINKDSISEGRVYKSITNPDITFKCISNKYLLRRK